MTSCLREYGLIGIVSIKWFFLSIDAKVAELIILIVDDWWECQVTVIDGMSLIQET